MFACDQCKFSATEKWLLKRHMQIKHAPSQNEAKKRELQCPKANCSYRTVTPRSLELHLRDHPSGKPLKCTECSFTCKEPRNLKRHQHKMHFSRKHYQCSQCSYVSRTSDKLKEHKIRHLTKQEKEGVLKACPISNCKFKTVYKGNMATHLKTHSADKPFKCDKCAFRCKILANLQSHMVTHLNKKEVDKLKLGCPVPNCNYTTIRPHHLRTHLRVHTNERPFKCNYCKYEARESSRLAKHMKHHHAPSLTSLECKFCGLSLPAADWKCHRKLCEFKELGVQYKQTVPHGNEKLICDVKIEDDPPRGTELGGLMINNARLKVEVTPFKCEECDFSSKRSLAMKAHAAQHLQESERSGLRQDCPVPHCEYKTELMPDLCEHLQTHAEQWPCKNMLYSCKLCEFLSNRDEILALHNETVHSVPFVVLKLRSEPFIERVAKVERADDDHYED